jgi:hypothetical protein
MNQLWEISGVNLIQFMFILVDLTGFALDIIGHGEESMLFQAHM